jgi:type II protein arginine methyltransferase
MADNDPATAQKLERLDLYLKNKAWDIALDTANSVLAGHPKHEAALRGAVEATTGLMQLKNALKFLDRLLELNPNDASLWHKSAYYADEIRHPSAYERSARSCQIDPGNPTYERLRRTLAGKVIPKWHFDMMNDAPRNRAYADAIARHVKGKLVLEIGTGAGLLALLAARNGARRVITCEANATLAEVARQIVAVNGFADVITVVPKMSNDLVVGDDLPEKADILITETFAELLIGEGVIGSLNDARARLLKPGARAIPAVAVCCGALAASETLVNLVRVDTVYGFNMAPLNRFAPVSTGMKAPVTDITWMSDAKDLVTVDMNGPAIALKGMARLELKATSPGRAAGIVIWIRLDLDDGISFDNKPGDAKDRSHWAPHFFPFPHPLELKVGQRVSFDCFYTNRGVVVDLNGFGLSG